MKSFKAVEPEPPKPEPASVERESFVKALLAKPFIADVQIFDDIKDAIVIEEITFSDGSKILFDIHNSDYDTAWVSVEYEPANSDVVHYNDDGELETVFNTPPPVLMTLICGDPAGVRCDNCIANNISPGCGKRISQYLYFKDETE